MGKNQEILGEIGENQKILSEKQENLRKTRKKSVHNKMELKMFQKGKQGLKRVTGFIEDYWNPIMFQVGLKEFSWGNWDQNMTHRVSFRPNGT